jgi:hypothetical protein
MSTEKEIYLLSMAQSGKSFAELTDDDLMSALGTDNAISRSKQDDPADLDQLKKNMRAFGAKIGTSTFKLLHDSSS